MTNAILKHDGAKERASAFRTKAGLLKGAAFGLEDDGRDVVLKAAPGEVAHGVEEGVEDGIQLPVVIEVTICEGK